jgi:hypothetical protein
MMLFVHFPVEEFNAAVRDGSAGSKLHHILEETQPEAVYFTEHAGERGAVVVADVASPARIPALAEPWFLQFKAKVEFKVAMTPADLSEAGLDEMGRKWGRPPA